MLTPFKERPLPTLLALYIAFVFLQSLFFKFTGSPETQHIFGTLDDWAAGYGYQGLFASDGIFSAYVIGTIELIASLLLIFGTFAGKLRLQSLGALIALGVITGAVFFHLFTPLGTEVMGDGGLLFAMAVGVWIAAVLILWTNRNVLKGSARTA